METPIVTCAKKLALVLAPAVACLASCHSVHFGGDVQTLNVIECGADPTGWTDSTAALTSVHARGLPVYYPNGTYRFNGATLDLSGGVRFESRTGVIVRNDISPEPILQFDAAGNLIGLQQNHLEKDQQDLSEARAICSGSLVAPPLSDGPQPAPVDVLAHWYNDFGLETRRLNPGSGWIGWYYWTWNFHDAPGDGYDPARHPLLGFYRGDDPTVLDWQCYWLAEYGVKGVILCWGSKHPAQTLAQWDHPASPAYWIHQLFNRVPNFKRLKYVMWAPTPWLSGTAENRANVEQGWRYLIDTVYRRYDNCYILRIGKRRYPVLYLWEEGALRGLFDNYRGAKETHAFYVRMAERFRQAGFDGMALFARHPYMPDPSETKRLEQAGVLHYRAYYSNPLSRDAGTYAKLVDTFCPPTDPSTVINVVTAHQSHTPHPSRWKCPGSTPVLFRRLLQKAVRHVCGNPMPRVVTCYNVAEWAEGGPGLQPNMRDRFGYLQAVRNALSIVPSQ